jgi:hypothetical protein
MTTYGSTLFFGFVYRNSGGFAGAKDRISYKSITKKLIFVDMSSKQNEKQQDAMSLSPLTACGVH